MEYRRRVRKTKSPVACFFEWLFLDVVSCYCTKPFRVLFVSLIVIFIFAAVFLLSTMLSLMPDSIEFGKNYNGVKGCIYHSIITFFTIGYGDSKPIGTLGLILTGLEGFSGVFLMALFTVSFVRKVLR